jgi:inner membrane protease subunit 2
LSVVEGRASCPDVARMWARYIATPGNTLFLKRVAFATPIVFTFHQNVASVAKVSGTSMQPTLNEADIGGKPPFFQDYVLINKVAARRLNYERGDVVTLWSPESDNTCLIKRVVGLAGDWVRVPTEHNRSQLKHVPPGPCWVEGDNSAASRDSAAFGAVPLALLTGTVEYVVWPPWSVRKLEAGLPPKRRAVGRPESPVASPPDAQPLGLWQEQEQGQEQSQQPAAPSEQPVYPPCGGSQGCRRVL